MQVCVFISILWLSLRTITPFLGAILVVANSLPFLGLLEKMKILLRTKDPIYTEIRILIPTIVNVSM